MGFDKIAELEGTLKEVSEKMPGRYGGELSEGLELTGYGTYPSHWETRTEVFRSDSNMTLGYQEKKNIPLEWMTYTTDGQVIGPTGKSLHKFDATGTTYALVMESGNETPGSLAVAAVQGDNSDVARIPLQEEYHGIAGVHAKLIDGGLELTVTRLYETSSNDPGKIVAKDNEGKQIAL